MTFTRLFKVAAASATIAGTAAAGGFAGYVAAPALAERLTPATAPVVAPVADSETADLYHADLDALAEAQADLDNTTDQEEEVAALDAQKKVLAASVVLDRRISESDFVTIAVRFNNLSDVDGIRLRSINFDPRAVAYRGNCLDTTSATDPRWGNDRYAYAQRVETCMIEKWQEGADIATPAPAANDTDANDTVQKLAIAGGAAGGGMLAFGFSLGYAVRGNRRQLKAAKPG